MFRRTVVALCLPLGLVAAAEFDPDQGVEANGRIPKVPLPITTDHPERYRYVPEGRIVPGNQLDRMFVSFFPSPIFFYEEAIGAGGGVALVDIDFRNQRRQEFLGLFVAATTKGQEAYRAVWQRWLDQVEVPGGGIVQQDRSFVRVEAGYERTLTRRFFGLGDDTRAADETSYTDELTNVGASVEQPLGGALGDLVALGGISAVHRNLYTGQVPDIPSSDEVFPGLVAAADGRSSLWLFAGLRLDTRDSTENPYAGGSLEARADYAPWQNDGYGAATITTVKATWAVAVPSLFHDGGLADLRASGVAEENPPTDTVVVGARTQRAWGDVAFADLPNLGGSNTLRGYIGDRWTGRSSWNAGIEWRTWVIPRGVSFTRTIRIERFGLAPFADFGAVSADPTGLGRASPTWSVGNGFRIGFERDAIFRIDIAKSPEDVGVNVDFGMAF
jgi:hypothetical protein